MMEVDGRPMYYYQYDTGNGQVVRIVSFAMMTLDIEVACR